MDKCNPEWSEYVVEKKAIASLFEGFSSEGSTQEEASLMLSKIYSMGLEDMISQSTMEEVFHPLDLSLLEVFRDFNESERKKRMDANRRDLMGAWIYFKNFCLLKPECVFNDLNEIKFSKQLTPQFLDFVVDEFKEANVSSTLNQSLHGINTSLISKLITSDVIDLGEQREGESLFVHLMSHPHATALHQKLEKKHELTQKYEVPSDWDVLGIYRALDKIQDEKEKQRNIEIEAIVSNNLEVKDKYGRNILMLALIKNGSYIRHFIETGKISTEEKHRLLSEQDNEGRTAGFYMLGRWNNFKADGKKNLETFEIVKKYGFGSQSNWAFRLMFDFMDPILSNLHVDSSADTKKVLSFINEDWIKIFPVTFSETELHKVRNIFKEQILCIPADKNTDANNFYYKSDSFMHKFIELKLPGKLDVISNDYLAIARLSNPRGYSNNIDENILNAAFKEWVFQTDFSSEEKSLLSKIVENRVFIGYDNGFITQVMENKFLEKHLAESLIKSRPSQPKLLDGRF